MQIRNDLIKYVALPIAVLGILFYIWNLDRWRMDDDEGSYLYQAWRISEGEVPYRDFFTPQLPLFLYSGATLMRVFGGSLFSIRIASAILMALASLLVFILAKRLSNTGVAFLATLAFLLHPDVYRQARLFRPEAYMLLLSILGLLSFTLGVEGGRRKYFIVSGALLGLATLAKPFGLLPLLGCLLFVGVEALRENGRKWRRVLGDGIALLIPYIIIVVVIFGAFQLLTARFLWCAFGHHMTQGRELGIWKVLAKHLRFFWGYFLGYVPLLLFAIPAAFEAIRLGGPKAALAWQLPTVMAFFGISRPLTGRHLMYLIPSLCTLFALSLERLLTWPRRAFLIISIIGTLLLPWVVRDVIVAGFADGGTMLLAEFIESNTDEDDLVLSDYAGYNFYARRRSTYFGAGLSHGAASTGQVTGRKLMKEIEEGDVKMVLIDVSPLTGHQLVGLRDYNCFRGYVLANFELIEEFKLGDQRIEVYRAKRRRLISTLGAIPPVQHPLRANLGDRVELLGYALSSSEVEPGGILRLTLYWLAKREMETDYTVFTHLIDAEGRIWGQKDSQPLGGLFPTTCWAEGSVICDDYEILVQPDAPPGEYALEIGMYELETMQRLPAYDENGKRLPEDRVLLSQRVRIELPALPQGEKG